MFCYFVMVDDFAASRQSRLPFPADRRSCHARDQCFQFGLRGTEQFLRCVCAVRPTERYSSDQTFTGEFWGADLRQPFDLQILSDQMAIVQQATDRAAAQAQRSSPSLDVS